MSANERDDENELRSAADLAFERGDFDEARAIYRQLTTTACTSADIDNLISAEACALRVHLTQLWQATGDWHIGYKLADNSSPGDAMRIYGELLRGELPQRDRWRIQCKRLELLYRRGTPGDGLIQDFLSAWAYLETLGQPAATLRRGMAKMLAGANNEIALDFLTELRVHPDFPPTLEDVVRLKKRELALALAVD